MRKREESVENTKSSNGYVETVCEDESRGDVFIVVDSPEIGTLLLELPVHSYLNAILFEVVGNGLFL